MSKLVRNGRNCNLKRTLCSGQAFRWKQAVENPEVFHGVLHNCALRLEQVEEDVIWDCLTHDSDASGDCQARLESYLSLRLSDVDDGPHRDKWIARAPIFEEILTLGKGTRFLNQDPLEVFVSFLCSQNNNVPRIMSMVSKFACEYGASIPYDDPLGVWPADFQPAAFPNISHLISNPNFTSERLRELGFGYRAASIVEGIRLLQDEMDRLEQLWGELRWEHNKLSPHAEGEPFDISIMGRDEEPNKPNTHNERMILVRLAASIETRAYHSAHPSCSVLDLLRVGVRHNLLSYDDVANYFIENYKGIGPKVADCICLYALQCMEAVPIDTRINQMIAAYLDEILNLKHQKAVKSKEMVYRRRAFVERFEAAGLAQLIMYVASFDMLKSTDRKKRSRPSDMA